jgi:outer membrane protein OmpA-like peptidoglycan-associated protein
MLGLCLISFLAVFPRTDSLKIPQKTPIDQLNTYKSQYFPWYSVSLGTIFYTVRKNQQRDEDLVFSRDSLNHFSVPKDISELNLENNEGTPSFSSDGNKMIFSACDYPNSMGGCDLFESNWNGGKWTQPKNLGYLINSHEWEGHPYLSADGTSLYFSSDRSGGFGRKDIWVSKKNEQGIWQIPQNLGAQINSKMDDLGPLLLENRKILIFSSNRMGGIGGLDFYQSLKNTDAWSKPQNISSINSQKDDAGICRGPNQQVFFLSSSSDGSDKIYSVKIPEDIWMKISEKPLEKTSLAFDSIHFDDIQFNNNEWNLAKDPPKSLILLVSYLKENNTSMVKIAGHTDEIGTEEHNQILSEKRALSVKLFLIQQGIQPERITFQGYGYSKSKLVDKAHNRRIEIELMKK